MKEIPVLTRDDVEKKFHNRLPVFPFKRQPILFGFDAHFKLLLLMGFNCQMFIDTFAMNNNMHFDPKLFDIIRFFTSIILSKCHVQSKSNN